MGNSDSLKFEIINELGIISDGSKGWHKEFNRVSWNGGEPKYDIRDWDESHEKMGKGITLKEAELRKLKELLDNEIMYLDSGAPNDTINFPDKIELDVENEVKNKCL